MSPTLQEPLDAPRKHVTVREFVRELAVAADPGFRIPSERQLVEQFGVARMTVRQAIDGLVAEGLLERVPGSGTFVTRPPQRGTRLQGLTEDLAARGIVAESRTLLARRERANEQLAVALQVTEGDPVVHWRRLRLADGAPVCVEDTWLTEVMLPGFLESGVKTSLYDALATRGMRPTWAEDKIVADLPTEAETELLGLATPRPVLRVRRRALWHDRPVLVTRAVYRSDRHILRVEYAGD